MNIFAAEELIIARINAQMPGVFGLVGPISAYSGYDDIAQYLPAIIVAPDDAAVVGDPADGNFQQENQTWQVTLIVESTPTKTIDDPDRVTALAGTHIYNIMQALIGWVPQKGFKAMAYRGRGEPFLEPGYGEFPIFFETGLVITGTGGTGN